MNVFLFFPLVMKVFDYFLHRRTLKFVFFLFLKFKLTFSLFFFLQAALQECEDRQ